MRNETKTSAAMFDQPLPARVLEQSRIVRTSLARRKQVRDLRFIRKVAVTETQGHLLPELNAYQPIYGTDCAKPLQRHAPRQKLTLTPAMIRFAQDSPLKPYEIAALLGSSVRAVGEARRRGKTARSA